MCVCIFERKNSLCVCVYVNWEKIHSVLYICSTYIYKFIVYMWKLGEIEFNDRDFIVFVCIWERMHFVCVFKSYSSLCVYVCVIIWEREILLCIYICMQVHLYENSLCVVERQKIHYVLRDRIHSVYLLEGDNSFCLCMHIFERENSLCVCVCFREN